MAHACRTWGAEDGALVATHVKLGLGCNFSEFSDDLTELDFNHQGLFLNLTCAM